MLTSGGSGKIHILPGNVVSRIAAGEVVERPSAVVKELVENSLDAGSCSVIVEIKDGGATLIRVTDDGEGMSRDDAPRAFERHATSKLQSDRDLWSIRTMGFRGEALPSIASVSRVRVATALRSAEVGIEFRIQEGRIDHLVDAPPVSGTCIEVAELFYNQPARKKFLKSVPTEFSHISRVVQQAALAWPSVHFRLIHNGTEIVHYPAVLSERDRIGQVYGPLFLGRCRQVEAELPIARIRGYVVDPVHARSSRIPQELFLNRRPVRNAAVFHAVAEGYGASLPKGRHPLFVLFLDVDPDRVDVNIHPAKREVRFAEPDLIHQLVRRAVRQAMGSVAHPLRTHCDDRARPAGDRYGLPGPQCSGSYPLCLHVRRGRTVLPDARTAVLAAYDRDGRLLEHADRGHVGGHLGRGRRAFRLLRFLRGLGDRPAGAGSRFAADIPQPGRRSGRIFLIDFTARRSHAAYRYARFSLRQARRGQRAASGNPAAAPVPVGVPELRRHQEGESAGQGADAGLR